VSNSVEYNGYKYIGLYGAPSSNTIEAEIHELQLNTINGSIRASDVVNYTVKRFKGHDYYTTSNDPVPFMPVLFNQNTFEADSTKVYKISSGTNTEYLLFVLELHEPADITSGTFWTKTGLEFNTIKLFGTNDGALISGLTSTTVESDLLSSGWKEIINLTKKLTLTDAYTPYTPPLSLDNTTLTASGLPATAKSVTLYRDDVEMATSAEIYKTFDTVSEVGPIIGKTANDVNALLGASGTTSALDSGDYFGASLAVYGNTMVVGATYDDDKGSNAGAVYVFTHENGTWIQEEKIVAVDGGANDQFGHSVAIHDNTIVVGARLDDDKGTDAGSAYVFIRTDAGWKQQAKLTASNGSSTHQFGVSVDIYEDTLIVGSVGNKTAYVYIRNGVTWEEKHNQLCHNRFRVQGTCI